ncbi:hypothetical protein AGIG_G24055 [Arapaima gigas]
MRTEPRGEDHSVKVRDVGTQRFSGPPEEPSGTSADPVSTVELGVNLSVERLTGLQTRGNETLTGAFSRLKCDCQMLLSVRRTSGDLPCGSISKLCRT